MNVQTSVEETFYVQGSSFTKPRIIEILKEIHPEYEQIVLTQAKIPKGANIAWDSQYESR
jgi:hypothetical protein